MWCLPAKMKRMLRTRSFFLMLGTDSKPCRVSRSASTLARARSAQKAIVLVIFLVSFTGLYYSVNEGREAFNDGFTTREDEAGRSLWDLFTLNNNENEDKRSTPALCSEHFFGNPYPLVKEVRNLIVDLTNLYDEGLIDQLERTLNTTTADLPALLDKIKRFQKSQRCTTCSDRRTLPATFIGTNSSIPSCGYWNGLRLPIVGIKPHGRLGNVMGEYATLIALREIFNVTVVLTRVHQEKMIEFFPHLTLPVVDIGRESDWSELPEETPFYPYYGGLQLAALGLLGSKIFLSTGYPFEMSLFNAHRDKIRQEFRFSDEIVNKAQNFLSEVAANSVLSRADAAISFIGVHVRMTDYMKQITDGFGAPPVDYGQFVARAVHYYEARMENPVFVVASDDIEHAKRVFQELGQKNVFYSEGSPTSGSILSWFTSKDRPGEDMALLSQCNHSIITLGSYGFWAGYLSKGLVLYPDVKTTRPYSFSRPFYEEAKINDFIPIKL